MGDLAEIRANFIPFSAQTRMSGVELGGSWVRKGAVDSILSFLNTPPAGVVQEKERAGRQAEPRFEAAPLVPIRSGDA